MVLKSIPSTDIRILRLLAENKEYAQYDMWRAINKNYRTILRRLPILEKAGLIQVVRLEPSEKGGKEKKIYRITLQGLRFWVLMEPKVAEDKFELIAKAHKDKLLVFKKWSYFKQKGLANFIKQSFFEGITQLTFLEAMLYFAHSKVTGDFPKERVDDEKIAENINIAALKLFIGTPLELVKKSAQDKWGLMLKLYKAIMQDKELREFVEKIIKRKESELKRNLKTLEGWKQLLSQL